MPCRVSFRGLCRYALGAALAMRLDHSLGLGFGLALVRRGVVFNPFPLSPFKYIQHLAYETGGAWAKGG